MLEELQPVLLEKVAAASLPAHMSIRCSTTLHQLEEQKGMIRITP